MSDRAYAQVQVQQKTLIGPQAKSNFLQRTCACGQHTIAGGECSACRNQRSTLLRSQRAFEPPSAPGAAPGSSPAQENGTAFNASFDRESRFGHDFSQIPIHSPSAGVIQTKLAINQPGDHYEQEADRISQQVMRMPEPQLQRACVCGGGCPKCQTEQPGQVHVRLQTKRVQARNTGQIAAPPIVHEVLRSPGQPLDPATRAFMEPRFGHDFSQVRVHTSAAAEQSAQDVNANAYTVGHDIVFSAGSVAPGTHQGRRLLAHELTHVAQQNGGMAVVHRAPADGTRWGRDEAAARYRGQLMAKRIRNHGKLSKEARAKINRELAYFEGSAKEAYLKEVRPALLAVTEIEMPAEQVVPRGRRPIKLSLLGGGASLCGGSRCFTDKNIYYGLREAEKQEEAEKALVREVEMQTLTLKTMDWRPDDQAFALDLLMRVLRYSPNVDPRAVSDANRKPILERYEQWMRKVDKKRIDECVAHPPSRLEIVHMRFSGEIPCVSWFSDEETPGYTHASWALSSLGSLLDIFRGASESAVDQVYWDVFEYRRNTDPKMLEMAQQSGEMVGGLAGVAGAVGEKFNEGGTVPPAFTAEEGEVVSSKSPVLSDQPQPGVPPTPQKPATSPHEMPKPVEAPTPSVKPAEPAPVVEPTPAAKKTTFTKPRKESIETDRKLKSAKDKRKQRREAANKQQQAREEAGEEQVDKRKGEAKKRAQEKQQKVLGPPTSDTAFRLQVDQAVKLDLNRTGLYKGLETWKLEELTGPSDFAVPDDQLPPGRGYRYDATYRKPDGSAIGVSVNYDPVGDHFGTIKESSGLNE